MKGSCVQQGEGGDATTPPTIPAPTIPAPTITVPTILVGMAVERWALQWGMRHATSPKCDVKASGMGRGRAQRLAARVGRSGARVLVISGTCAGISGDLVAGEVVLADSLWTERNRADAPEPMTFDERVLDELEALVGTCGVRVQRGPLVTVDHLVWGRRRRDRLARSGALAVDMESAWLARAAQGRPVAVARVVSDVPGRHSAPFALVPGGLAALQTLARIGPALAACNLEAISKARSS